MLNPDPKKLRWLGIDMRSRTRRRCVVVLTFGVLFVGLTALGSAYAEEPMLQRYHLGFWLMLLLVLACSLGIFRDGGVVKAFNERSWTMNGMPSRMVMLSSLDDRAEYRFGAKFDDLPEAEQTELLRTYRVGNYLFPAKASKAPTALDEREQAEKERANSATLKFMTTWLFAMAGSYAWRHEIIHGEYITSLLLTLGFIATYGPKAFILWTEPPPFDDGGPQLVAGYAGAAVE